MEGLVGVDGNRQALQVQAVVGLKELLHVGVLVALHLFRREAQSLEVLKGLVAHGVHYVAAVLADHAACLLI